MDRSGDEPLRRLVSEFLHTVCSPFALLLLVFWGAPKPTRERQRDGAPSLLPTFSHLVPRSLLQVLGCTLRDHVHPRTRALEDPSTSRIEVGWSLDRDAPLTFLCGDLSLDWTGA